MLRIEKHKISLTLCDSNIGSKKSSEDELVNRVLQIGFENDVYPKAVIAVF